jgi:hypothetical protein
MKPIVSAIREYGARVFGYLDDPLVVPAPAGRVATPRDCLRATTWIEKLLRKLGIVRQPTKRESTGTKGLEHLGMVIDKIQMKFFIFPRKIEKVQTVSSAILRQAAQGRWWVSRK